MEPELERFEVKGLLNELGKFSIVCKPEMKECNFIYYSFIKKIIFQILPNNTDKIQILGINVNINSVGGIFVLFGNNDLINLSNKSIHENKIFRICIK